MSVHQKLGIISENKVVQKLSLEKNVFNKKWSPKLIFLEKSLCCVMSARKNQPKFLNAAFLLVETFIDLYALT